MATNTLDQPQVQYYPNSEQHSSVSPPMSEEIPLRPVMGQLEPMGEPLPAKTELTVLSADEPSSLKLNWVMKEYSGVELYPIIDGRPGPEYVPMTEDLVVGCDYTASGLFGEHIRWTVGKNNHGEFQISSGSSLIGCLQRGGDDRNCWVVSGMINTRGIKKLEKIMEDG